MAIIIAGFFTWSMSTAKAAKPSNLAVLSSDFVADGYIVKDNPGLEAGLWYLVSEDAEVPAQTTELVFDDASICFGKTASGPCVPAIFFKGRSAHIEGEMTGTAVHVLRLTFTQEIQPGIYDVTTGKKVSE